MDIGMIEYLITRQFNSMKDISFNFGSEQIVNFIWKLRHCHHPFEETEKITLSNNIILNYIDYLIQGVSFLMSMGT